MPLILLYFTNKIISTPLHLYWSWSIKSTKYDWVNNNVHPKISQSCFKTCLSCQTSHPISLIFKTTNALAFK